MKRKLLMFASLLLVFATSVCNPSFARYRDQRHEIIRENVQTEMDIKSDPDMSRREARSLLRKNRKIADQEKRYAERHGGKLKRREVNRLKDAQDDLHRDMNHGEYRE